MFFRTVVRFPRAEYRPLTGYEEFFGYAGAKRNAVVLTVIGIALYSAILSLMARTHRNPEKNRAHLTPTEREMLNDATTTGALKERERLVIEAARREQELRQRGPR